YVPSGCSTGPNCLDGTICVVCPGVTPKPKPPKCPAWPQKDLATKGRIAIYVKVPFVEKLYDILVEAKDSLLRRFLPYGGPVYVINLSPAPTHAFHCIRNLSYPNQTAPTCSECATADSATCPSLRCCQWVSAFTSPPPPTPYYHCIR